MQEWRHTQKPDQINEKARRGQGKIEKKTFFSSLPSEKNNLKFCLHSIFSWFADEGRYVGYEEVFEL